MPGDGLTLSARPSHPGRPRIGPGRIVHGVRRALLGLGVAACAPALAAPPEVIIDPGGAPPKVLQAITNAVGAITRLTEDQDVREVSRLRRRAWEAAQAALRTQGYFGATVTLDVSPGAANGGEFWDIAIDTGERARVRQLGLRFEGALAGDAYAARRQSLRDIEAYIVQSVPRSAVDPALLEPVKREPRVVVANPDVVDEADSRIDTQMPPKPSSRRSNWTNVCWGRITRRPPVR